MLLLTLGINHKTAPVAVRERVAFAPERLGQALREMLDRNLVRGAAILSTCNRTELYCEAGPKGGAALVDWLGAYHAIPPEDIKPYVYTHPDQQAVRHLLRVAAGLDSMILGEPQILGQVKDAYQEASRAGTLGPRLERLFQHTFAVAKQVRTDTQIGASAVSVAFAAVSLARQIFADLGKQKALLIGAGETTELAARHLADQGIGGIIVANRTLERAHRLATEFGGYAIGLDEIPTHLPEADIVITATASPQPVLRAADVRAALRRRRHKPVLMVDIAVPRDIEPAVSELEDVYLYTVDDLNEIIEENLRNRRAAAEQAEEIIDTEVAHFMGWLRAQDQAGVMRALRHRAEAASNEVLDKALRRLASGSEPEEALRFLASALTNKLIHDPSAALREASTQGDRALIEAIKRVYRLDPSSH